MGLLEGELSGQIIGAAIEVHSQLGPGLLESAYSSCLVHELTLRGVSVESEVAVPLRYKGLTVPHAYRLDLLVEDRVIVELKTVERLTPVHRAQLLSYLRLTERRVGLLFNFNVKVLTSGFERLVL